MRRTLCTLTLTVLLTLGTMAQALAALPEGWAFRQEIILNPKAADHPVVILPAQVLGKAKANLEDIRIFDEQGNEIPYAKAAEVRQAVPAWEGKPYDQGKLPDGRQRATVDTGTVKLGHHRAILEVTGREYLALVTVEGSYDQQEWVQVAHGVLLDRPDKIDWVDYQPVHYRYLRFTLEAREGDPGEIRSVRVLGGWIASQEKDVLGEAVQMTGKPRLSEDGKALIWETALEGELPISDVTFAGIEGNLQRKTVVKVSQDGKQWRDAGRGLIFRYPGGGENLRVTFPPARGKHWQVWLYHENDKPLEQAVPSLHVPKTELYLPGDLKPQGKLYLYYGNREAEAPRYDLAQILSRQVSLTAAPAQLGPVETLQGGNPNVRPWTEENPWVLRLVLAAVVVGLAFVLYRSFGQAGDREKKE